MKPQVIIGIILTLSILILSFTISNKKDPKNKPYFVSGKITAVLSCNIDDQRNTSDIKLLFDNKTIYRFISTEYSKFVLQAHNVTGYHRDQLKSELNKILLNKNVTIITDDKHNIQTVIYSDQIPVLPLELK